MVIRRYSALHHHSGYARMRAYTRRRHSLYLYRGMTPRAGGTG